LSYAAFYQDDFKVTSKLTVNLGFPLRFRRPREERAASSVDSDPSVPNPAAGGRLGAFVSAGQGPLQAENFGLVNPDRTNFGPRLVSPTRSMRRPLCAAARYLLRPSSTTISETPERSVYSPGAVNINGGLDAFITLDNYPHIPVADRPLRVVGDLNRTDLDYFTRTSRPVGPRSIRSTSKDSSC